MVDDMIDPNEHRMPIQLACEITFDPKDLALRFVMEGDRGVVVFTLFTQWSPDMIDPVIKVPRPTVPIQPPLPGALSYHSPTPVFEGQNARPGCEFLNGDCYCDGSTLAAADVFATLLSEGTPGVWRRLAEFYDDVFEDANTESADKT